MAILQQLPKEGLMERANCDGISPAQRR